MSPPWSPSLVVICACLFVSIQARAQPMFDNAQSIDCTVANADTVVIGTLVDVRGRDRGSQFVTIAVEETLKGKHAPRLRARVFDPESKLSEYKGRSGRLLVATDAEQSGATTVIDLRDEKLKVLTAEFTLLRKPDDVIQAAREAVRRMPGVTRIHTFKLVVPRRAVIGSEWERYYETGGYVHLTVPVDERLEKRALEYIHSRDFGHREEAAKALRYFKSDANIARVKALLDDPEWASLHLAEENNGLEVRIYSVRNEAYETLNYWGIDAKKPVTREELWKPERVTSMSFSNTQVSDAKLKALARFKNLEDLYLWNTPVTDGNLREISRLTNLRSLLLGGTGVTDEKLTHLAGLIRLRYLDLASTNISDEGLKALAAFKSLNGLDLRGTKVTDEGLEVLAGFENLRKVDLGQTKVTDKGVAELRKLRPDLAIER